MLDPTQIFANDNAWNEEGAVMLGRFLALSKFTRKQAAKAIAVSPTFFYKWVHEKAI